MLLDLFADSCLSKLKMNWRKTIEGDGGYCPCCGKWGKISPFSITETHALALLWMSRAPCDSDGWIDVPPIAPSWMLRGKNYTTMAKWGLIENKSKTDTSKRSDGFWRVTPKGLNFICGTIIVPMKAYIYNNQVEGWSAECVSFENCFGRHFNYSEVMSDNFNLNEIKI